MSIGLYLLGVAIGVAVMRDPWRTRLVTAAFWPLGPAAFILVIFVLVLAAAYLWPVPVLGTAAVGAAILWFLL